jgi:hypothetical protein
LPALRAIATRTKDLSAFESPAFRSPSAGPGPGPCRCRAPRPGAQTVVTERSAYCRHRGGWGFEGLIGVGARGVHFPEQSTLDTDHPRHRLWTQTVIIYVYIYMYSRDMLHCTTVHFPEQSTLDTDHPRHRLWTQTVVIRVVDHHRVDTDHADDGAARMVQAPKRRHALLQ